MLPERKSVDPELMWIPAPEPLAEETQSVTAAFPER